MCVHVQVYSDLLCTKTIADSKDVYLEVCCVCDLHPLVSINAMFYDMNAMFHQIPSRLTFSLPGTASMFMKVSLLFLCPTSDYSQWLVNSVTIFTQSIEVLCLTRNPTNFSQFS